MTVNKAILLGSLGINPEIKTTQSGKEIGRFTLATSETWKDKNTGEKQQKTEWHNITVFGDKCKVLSYLEKGSKVFVEGKITTEKYTDSNGIEKYATKIIADVISVIKGKEKEKISQHSVDKGNGYQNQQEEESSDEIPF